MTIVIPGVPIAKKRPRFARRGKFVVTYNAQETEEGKFLIQVREQWKKPPTEGALKLKCRFCMPIPKGTSKKKIQLMLQDQIRHIKKPDLTNLLKFTEDCCNELIWKDDSQIVTIIGAKYYDTNPRTEIEVEEV